MTREEALNILHNASVYHPDYLDALNMAIKALEQEPVIDKVNKMKAEIASSLEFWDYSPNNNPLARDILETVTHFWGDIREGGT